MGNNSATRVAPGTRPVRGTPPDRGASHRRGNHARQRKNQRKKNDDYLWSEETLEKNSNSDEVFLETPGPKRLPPDVKEPIDHFLLYDIGETAGQPNQLVFQSMPYSKSIKKSFSFCV